MICRKCGTEVGVGEKFCPKCGAGIQPMRQRHGFVSVWLILSLAGSIFSGIWCLILPGLVDALGRSYGEIVAQSAQNTLVLRGGWMILGFLFYLCVGGAIVPLLKWKKIGFWVFCGCTLGVVVLKVAAASTLKQNGLSALVELISIPIMWGVLHIPKNGKNVWEQLE